MLCPFEVFLLLFFLFFVYEHRTPHRPARPDLEGVPGSSLASRQGLALTHKVLSKKKRRRVSDVKSTEHGFVCSRTRVAQRVRRTDMQDVAGPRDRVRQRQDRCRC